MIVVFGGDGLLGREIADAAISRGHPLAAIPHREADIADTSQVRQIIARFSPSIVINAAAYTDVEGAESAPDKAHRVNAEGARSVASACRQFAVPLIHISTDFVFNGSKQTPYFETDDVHPLNVYGKSKAAGEAHVMAETRHYAIIRTSWLFSKYGRNFMKTMLALAREQHEIKVVNDQFGCPTSARSLAAAVLNIAPRLCADKTLSGLYHFAGTPVTSRHEFAGHIVSAQAPSVGRAARIIAISSTDFGARAQRPARSALDCTKMKCVFDIDAPEWKPEVVNIVSGLVAKKRADHAT